MLNRLESGHACANLALRKKNCRKIKGNAPKLYGYEIGHTPANFAFVVQNCKMIKGYA